MNRGHSELKFRAVKGEISEAAPEICVGFPLALSLKKCFESCGKSHLVENIIILTIFNCTVQ